MPPYSISAHEKVFFAVSMAVRIDNFWYPEQQEQYHLKNGLWWLSQKAFWKRPLNDLQQRRHLKYIPSDISPLLVEKCNFESKHLTYKIFSWSSEGPCYLTPSLPHQRLFLDTSHRGISVGQTAQSFLMFSRNFQKGAYCTWFQKHDQSQNKCHS